MATYTDNTLASTLSDDATFRTWGQKFGAALTALGLVQTADTGQINWTTVLKPTVTQSSAGYEIWRFNDTLQATKPVFIKLEYGTGAGTTMCSLWVTVGSATNGAGGFTGSYFTTRKQIAAQSTSATSSTLWACGSTNRLAFFVGLGGSVNLSIFLNVERTKDATGADTDDGVYVLASSIANSMQQQLLPYPKNNGYPVVPAISSGGFIYPGLGSVSNNGVDIGVCPPVAFIGKAYYFLGCVVHANADIGAGGTFIVNLLGSNHTFLSLATMSAHSAINGAGTSHAISIRWE